MKTVHNSSMVAHLWANQSQSSARNAGNTFYFNDSTIYSYGSHFPIARHVDGVILFTTKDYSVTTAGHKSDVRRAIRGNNQVFFVPNVLADSKSEHMENHADYQKRMDALILKFSTSRLYKQMILDGAQKLAREANAYAERFKLRVKGIQVPNEEILTGLARVASAKHREELKKQRIAREERERAERNLRLAALDKWQKGQDVCTRYLPQDYVYLRAREVDGIHTLETSKGASVPLAHALVAFCRIQECKRTNTEWRRNGEQIPVGSFQIDAISPNGNVVAGCHKIHWDEIERFARSQNWITETVNVSRLIVRS